MNRELDDIKIRKAPYLAELKKRQAAEEEARKKLSEAREALQTNRETGLHDRFKRLRF